MQAETEHKVTAIRSSIALLRQHIGWDESVARLSELEREAEDQALWDNPERAQTVMREKNRLDRLIGGIREMEVTLDDAIELITLGEEEGKCRRLRRRLSTLYIVTFTLIEISCEDALNQHCPSNFGY